MRLEFDAAPDELSVFLAEAEEQLQLLGQDILTLEKKGADPELLQEVFRAAHALKGSSAAIGHVRMASLTHAMESVLDNLRKTRIVVTTSLIDLLLQGLDGLRVLKDEVVTLSQSGFDPSPLVASLDAFLDRSLQLPVAASRREARKPERNGFALVAPVDDPSQQVYEITVQMDRQPATKWVTHSKTMRIDIERLDALMNLVGKLVIDCTRLVELSSRLQRRYEGEETAQGLHETSLHIRRITDELQDKMMKARMFPVSSVLSRFPRMIRDLAQRAGKKVEFVMEGEDTELDRSVIEEIGDPLIHLLRNAVDHGIETPEVRLSRGKPEVGVVRLTACQRENRIVLVVEDDGKGIDPALVRQAAIEKGMVTAEAAARMNDRECLEMIFVPGVSTAEQLSDVSGRGVGMDIVRTNIHKLNGTVGIESAPGRGTRFTVELPPTLAIWIRS